MMLGLLLRVQVRIRPVQHFSSSHVGDLQEQSRSEMFIWQQATPKKDPVACLIMR